MQCYDCNVITKITDPLKIGKQYHMLSTLPRVAKLGPGGPVPCRMNCFLKEGCKNRGSTPRQPQMPTRQNSNKQIKYKINDFFFF